MNIPKGASHYLAGDFYHERGDGQYLIHLPDGHWGKAMISDVTEQILWPLSDDLTWLALECNNWPDEYLTHKMAKSGEHVSFRIWPNGDDQYTRQQWLTRRRELGLEQNESPEWDEQRIDTIGQNGNDGIHYDAVHNPEHYASGDIECIDAIRASMTPDEFAGYLKGNCQKYIWRYRQKGGAQDLAKAKWYLDRLEQHTNEYKGDAL